MICTILVGVVPNKDTSSTISNFQGNFAQKQRLEDKQGCSFSIVLKRSVTPQQETNK